MNTQIKSAKESLYEDDSGRLFTWKDIQKDIDDWVKDASFREMFEYGNDELDDSYYDYFEKDRKTPNYYKIYKDFWDISSNGAISEIEGTEEKWNEYNEMWNVNSSLEPEWTVFEPHFKNLKPRHELDPDNGWGAMEKQQKKIIEDNDHKVVVKYGYGGSCILYGAETGEAISPFSRIKDMQDFKKKNNLTIVNNLRRNNMIKSSKTSELFDKAILKAAELVKKAEEEEIYDNAGNIKLNEELDNITVGLLDLPFDFDLEPQELWSYIKKVVPADYFTDDRCWYYLYDVVHDNIYKDIGFNVNSSRRTKMKKSIKSANGSWDYQTDDMDEAEAKIGDIGISFTEPLLVADDGTIYTRAGFNEWLKFLEKEYPDNWTDAYETYHQDSDEEFIAMCKEYYFRHDFGNTLFLYSEGLKSIAESIAEEVPSNEAPFSIPSGFAFELYPEEEEPSGFNSYWIDDMELPESFIWGINPSLGDRFDVIIDPEYLWNGVENITSSRRTNMKKIKPVKSGRYIKSGAGAGYDVTIEGIELDSQNYKVISDEIVDEQYNEHNTLVEVPVKPCIVDKWEAQSYYDGIDSDFDWYSDADRKIEGGKATLAVTWYEHEEGRLINDVEFETPEEACDSLIPKYINIKVMVGAGWIHSNLPVEEVHFEDEYHHHELNYYEDGYDCAVMSVDLICPNICQDINAFFENPEEYYDDYVYDEDDEIESARKPKKSKHPDEVAKDNGADITCSRKPIKSGMSYEQALRDFTSNGKPWGDYWSMQYDWTMFIDSLERDGLVDYEESRWWDNPCTPETFREWKEE